PTSTSASAAEWTIASFLTLYPLQLPICLTLRDALLLCQRLERGIFVELLLAHDLLQARCNVFPGRLRHTLPALADQQRDLALQVVRLRAGKNFRRRPTNEFFVQLGQLACQHHRSLCAQYLDNIFHRL